VCLEVSAFEFRKRSFLAVTPSVLVLEARCSVYAAAPGPFGFLATHFVSRLVDELNGVKLIEGDRCPGQMLTGAGAGAGGA